MQSISGHYVFFFDNRAKFDEKYRNFIRYVTEIGAVGVPEGPVPNGEAAIVFNKDLIRWWLPEKSRAMFEKQIDMAQEVIALAQAKSVSEEEIWKMGLMDYYGALQAFIKYSEARNKINKND